MVVLVHAFGNAWSSVRAFIVDVVKIMSFYHIKCLFYYFIISFYNIPFIRCFIIQFYILKVAASEGERDWEESVRETEVKESEPMREKRKEKVKREKREKRIKNY